jgi:hypothetical protein
MSWCKITREKGEIKMGERIKVNQRKADGDEKYAPSGTGKSNTTSAYDSPFSKILHLQRTIGNRAVTRLIQSGSIQAKLKIGQPDDVYEKEADRAADQVMGMTMIGSECPECEEEEFITPLVQRQTVEGEEEIIQTKTASNSTFEVNPDIESRIQSLKGSGQPLSPSTRNFFEPRFGVDFSKVRTHQNTAADNLASSLGARAFTLGKDIWLGQGESTSDKKLMAHELTHVVQQKSNLNSKSVINFSPQRIFRVLVTLADVVYDTIEVYLYDINGPGGTGALTLQLEGPGNTIHVIRTVNRSAGVYHESFNIPNLAVGEYTSVRAAWQKGGTTASHTLPYHIRVLGFYRHSQYNTPTENTCAGNPVNVYITDNRCRFTPGRLRSGFVDQANLNGSGISINYGQLQRESYCLTHANAPANARDRSFRRVNAIYGSCNNDRGALNNFTVARPRNHPYLSCNDRVYIHNTSVKTVTDLCPLCAVAQLDNFTTINACAGIPDLGNFMTIKIF